MLTLPSLESCFQGRPHYLPLPSYAQDGRFREAQVSHWQLATAYRTSLSRLSLVTICKHQRVLALFAVQFVESIWNVMAHGDARVGKWRENWRMEWVASTLHPTSEHGVFSINTADVHTSVASSRLNWCPCRLNGLIRFAERRNLASARVSSHFKSSLLRKYICNARAYEIYTLQGIGPRVTFKIPISQPSV